MAVTWNVVSLDATKTVGSLSDVVTAVHWTASDADGDHTGSSYGSVGLAEADSKSFTAYASITKDNAIAWAKAALGADEVTAIENGIAAQITESKTPTTSTGVPWS
tara:strand:- start:827 stop:1144 length:318 start_codon:yes stop_codon:yes gene_type:complete